MRRVLILIVEGVQTLDATGPAEVFAAAESGGRKCYRVEFGSIGGGEHSTSSGLRILTKDVSALRLQATDTLVVAGADEDVIRRESENPALLQWLKRAARSGARITSVCSGSFLLAAAGLLDGKTAATHWLGCKMLADMYPRVHVDANAIFVRDGNTWTSAGVTTGIDMALAIVESDIDRAAADAIAALLVLYMRRPGYQSQFSQAMIAQNQGSDPLGAAITWARANLPNADIETLARRAGLSVRTLHRRCLQHLGTTPAKLMDKLRVEHARTLLTTSELPAKTLAEHCGFGNATRMHRAFVRELGMGPRDYRVLHAKA